MDALPHDLIGVAGAARERLNELARSVAAAGTGIPGSQGAMAAAARQAIFSDALLGALHARLEELKSVTK